MDKLSHLILDVVDNKRWVGIKVSRKGHLVSHLMFVDDLLLFGKAIESQVANMMEVLDVSYTASSQLISKKKTRILFSSNTLVGIRRKIVPWSGLREVDDLGLYLGFLSPARALGSATFSSLLISGEDKKMHTVRWQDIYKPKRLGGLGLKHLVKMNEACLSKRSWKLQSGEEAFWCKLLKKKYNKNGIKGNTKEVKAYDSSLWKNLAKELCNVAFNPDLCVTDTVLIDLVDINGNWNCNVFKEHLPRQCVQQIRAIAPPIRNSSSYELRVYSAHVVHSRQWSRIWKILVPERIRYHVWMIHVQGLKTNQLLFQRKLRDPFCGHCNNVVESPLRVLRDCRVSMNVWMSLVPHIHHSSYFSTDLEEWMDLNLPIL
ncbi:hypothetical protein KIW84_060678 [Lathyrus oleraceus]|uniref:Reverse transcriptase zinc-binding domain-containing protein n=1 Tax=Pisum sativum TaxID=3888 RepID=A0A9D4W1J0_PEA|nr:hypothetical protein KIW84_060678 [Pisum sativum]